MNATADNTKISVVIPCRGHAGPLAACLSSVLRQNCAGHFEVIVVDSAADPAVAKACEAYPSVRLIRRSEGLLPGAARNLGVSQARGEFLVFIDADCVAEPGWIEALVDALGQAVLTGGAVQDGKPWHPVAAIDNFLQFAAQPPGRPKGPAPLLPSCSMAIRRAEFEAVGGFPSIAEPAGEDGLFCLRVAARRPDQILFVPAARIRHFGRETVGQLWAHQYRFGHARSVLALHLPPLQRQLGRHWAMAPFIAVKRLGWLLGRALAWQPSALLKMLLFFPFLLIGMGGWCAGFRQGCNAIEMAGDPEKGAVHAAE